MTYMIDYYHYIISNTAIMIRKDKNGRISYEVNLNRWIFPVPAKL